MAGNWLQLNMLISGDVNRKNNVPRKAEKRGLEAVKNRKECRNLNSGTKHSHRATLQNCKIFPNSIINQCAVFLSLITFQTTGCVTQLCLPGLYLCLTNA